MATKRSQEGYLQIDHRASPGIPAELLVRWQAEGKMDPAAGVSNFESATVTCCHCNTVVVLNPDRSRPRGYCRRCDHYVCDNPACNRDCTPFEQILVDAQNAAYHAEQHGVPVDLTTLILPARFRR